MRRVMKNWVYSNLMAAAERRNISFDIIQYGMKTLGLFVTECFIALLFSELLNVLPEAIAFVCVFTILRGYCGGYHCKTYFSCMLAYVLMVVFSVLASKALNYQAVIVLLIVCSIFLFVNSPVENENNTLEKKYFGIYKKKAQIRIIICIIIITVLAFDMTADIWKAASMGIVALSSLCFIQLIRRNYE